jgi:DNA-binding IclR family transcriptional regulator
VGEVFPLATTANGLACLALMPDERAHELFTRDLPVTPTAADLDAFQRKLDAIRKDGLAYDLDEHTPGISAIGFAFCDMSGNYHAISVPVPTLRFAGIRPLLETVLREARDKVLADNTF